MSAEYFVSATSWAIQKRAWSSINAYRYFVSLRLYKRLKTTKPENKAQNLVEWLYTSPNIELADPTLELALMAGKIKKEFSLALTDAYVIASSELYRGKAVFRSREKEIQENITVLMATARANMARWLRLPYTHLRWPKPPSTRRRQARHRPITSGSLGNRLAPSDRATVAVSSETWMYPL